MEDKRPVTGTGGDGTGQKTQTLIFTYGRFVNAGTGMCITPDSKRMLESASTSSLFQFKETDLKLFLLGA